MEFTMPDRIIRFDEQEDIFRQEYKRVLSFLDKDVQDRLLFIKSQSQVVDADLSMILDDMLWYLVLSIINENLSGYSEEEKDKAAAFLDAYFMTKKTHDRVLLLKLL